MNDETPDTEDACPIVYVDAPEVDAPQMNRKGRRAQMKGRKRVPSLTPAGYMLIPPYHRKAASSKSKRVTERGNR